MDTDKNVVRARGRSGWGSAKGRKWETSAIMLTIKKPPQKHIVLKKEKIQEHF